MKGSRIWVVYLEGPDGPETSACRAGRIQEALGATLLGVGFGLSRVGWLDRLFPLCFSGWRPTRVGELIGSACHVMQAGDRLDLHAARVTARHSAPDRLPSASEDGAAGPASAAS